MSARRATKEKVMRKSRQRASLAFPILTAALLAASAPAHADSEKEIADRIAKTYGVTVLKTTQSEANGKPVLYVTVMNPGGNSNGAFKVTTLEVDPATGELMSQYRTTPTGQIDEGPISREPSYDQSGETMRQLSTRGANR
jgi:hypothetical protein